MNVAALVRQGNVIFVGELTDVGSLSGKNGFQDLPVDVERIALWGLANLTNGLVIGTHADFSDEKLERYMRVPVSITVD